MSNPYENTYSLTGENAKRAVELGLAEADWYTCYVPKDKMRKLLERRNGPAIVDTLIWLTLLIGPGIGIYLLWGSWWVLVPFMLYSLIYASTSDSRWHETEHGTAFKTDWMNNALYELASFMVMRESTLWRWSHTRHHSDTIIVGRDPEISIPRPADIKAAIFNFFNLSVIPGYFKSIMLHSLGRMTDAEKTFVPEEEFGKIYFKARIYLAIYLVVIGSALYFNTFLPFMYIGLPSLVGAWMMPIYYYTQHAGLAENVLDHRLNCRTVYMNRLNRFLYWNMNYHVEHHMFPLVPYHNLPKLHALIKDDCPPPYRGIINAYKEIIPAVLKQVKDPGYFVKRKLPERKAGKDQHSYARFSSAGKTITDGWIEVCPGKELHPNDVVRFDHNNLTFAIYRTDENQLYATDGICTHGNTHLAEGLLVKGNQIECPKHNGRFDITDGSPQRRPVCAGLRTYEVREQDGKVELNLESAGGVGVLEPSEHYPMRVVSSRYVATFIKELVLEPEEGSSRVDYQPGDYIQLDIPAYDEIRFDSFEVGAPYDAVWRAHHVFDYTASNEAPTRRNYSIAADPARDNQLRFNVRIATPPRGQDCPAGVGSTYVHSLKPGDRVTAVGPFGDFHIKDSDREMIYIGGGAGMAPLRSHLSHLFETQNTQRRVSFWYGARSRQEIFYQDYFDGLAANHGNFSFAVALSEPQPEDNWNSHTGYIHEVVKREYLDSHPDLSQVEFYLCGPPAMMQATREMLEAFGVGEDQIAYDEF